MKYFFPEYLYTEGRFMEKSYFAVDDQGIITEIGFKADLESEKEGEKFSGVVIPGFVNSHSHAFQILLRGDADNARNFKDWVNSFLYPLVKKLTKRQIKIASKVAYAQMLRNGITTVGEFHYLHNSGNEKLDEESALSNTVIAGAKEVGIRTRFLYSGYDLGSRPGQKIFNKSTAEVLRSLSRLKKKYSSDPLVHIGCAPHSIHGASKDMIEQLKKWSTENNEPIHIHLAEQKDDTTVSMEKHSLSPVEFLAYLGILQENLSIVHGIWITEKEIPLLKENKVTLVYNPNTNMYLGDGIAPILSYLENGVPIALGTDANMSLDILKEARNLEWLQRIKSLDMGQVKSVKQMGKEQKSPGNLLFDMLTINGGKALKLPIGELAVGNYADFLVLKTHDLSVRNLLNLPNFYDQLISSSSISHLLKQVFVGGRMVYDNLSGFPGFDSKQLVEDFNNLEL